MIIDYKELVEVRDLHPGKKIVFSDGVFDLLHVGHIEHLKHLSELGDLVVVGIMSDAWVRGRKGNGRPIMGEEERAALIDCVRYVHYTVLLNDLEKKERVRTTEALALLRPDIFATSDSTWSNHGKELKTLGVELKVAERVPPNIATTVEDISTSKLIKRVQRLNSI